MYMEYRKDKEREENFPITDDDDDDPANKAKRQVYVVLLSCRLLIEIQ